MLNLQSILVTLLSYNSCHNKINNLNCWHMILQVSPLCALMKQDNDTNTALWPDDLPRARLDISTN